MILKCVNDSSRLIYAFEMLPPPTVDTAQSDITRQELSSENCVANNAVTMLPKPAAQPADVLHTCDIVNDLLPRATAESNRNNSPVSDIFCADEGGDRLNNQVLESSLTTSLGGDVVLLETSPDVNWQYNQLSDMATDSNVDGAGTDGFCGTGLWSSAVLTPLDVRCCADEGDRCAAMAAAAVAGNGDRAETAAAAGSSSLPAPTDRKRCDEKQAADDGGGGGDAAEASRVADEWKSCAICLEEMEDDELLVHAPCGSTLCTDCHRVSRALLKKG